MAKESNSLALCTPEEFRKLFKELGATQLAKHLGCTERSVYKRRRILERREPIFPPEKKHLNKSYPHRATLSIENGFVIIGSDFHIWPGQASVALRAFKKFCKDLKPKAVILNGDVLDFPKISRHAAIGWEQAPLPAEEIEAAQDHLNDIEQACGKAEKFWTLGNHDARFESFIALHAPQLQGLKGISLMDHFALWQWTWSVWINDEIVVKHRYKGGIHAPYNNTVYSGKTIVTGHLHSQKITPFTDYSGTRYGVDTGCCADTDHTAFVNYTEDNPKNWISGFVVLKFVNGQLLYPQLVTVWGDNHVQYLGEIFEV